MAKLQAVKVTLSTGRVVILREIQISDTDLAAEQVAKRANGDALLLSAFMQKALIQNIILEIDGKAIAPLEREDLNKLLKISEYSQLTKVVGKMMGGDDAGKDLPLEVVTTGDN